MTCGAGGEVCKTCVKSMSVATPRRKVLRKYVPEVCRKQVQCLSLEWHEKFGRMFGKSASGWPMLDASIGRNRPRICQDCRRCSDRSPEPDSGRLPECFCAIPLWEASLRTRGVRKCCTRCRPARNLFFGHCFSTLDAPPFHKLRGLHCIRNPH